MNWWFQFLFILILGAADKSSAEAPASLPFLKDSSVVVHAKAKDGADSTVFMAEGSAAETIISEIPSVQEWALRTYGKVKTILVTDRPLTELVPFKPVRDHKLSDVREVIGLSGSTTHVLYTEEAARKILARENNFARKVSVIGALVRSVASGAIYFLYIPGLSSPEALASTLLTFSLNYFWASDPGRWDRWQREFQRRAFRVNAVNWIVHEGLYSNVRDFTTRLLFSFGYGSLVGSLHFGFWDQGPAFLSQEWLSKMGLIMFTGGAASSLWDEALNRWTKWNHSSLKNSGVLTVNEFVWSTLGRHLIFAVLVPLTQAGYTEAYVTSAVMGAAGLTAFFKGDSVFSFLKQQVTYAVAVTNPMMKVVRNGVSSIQRQMRSVSLKVTRSRQPIQLGLRCSTVFR